MIELTDYPIYRDLGGIVCPACNQVKRVKNSFCPSCYNKLPHTVKMSLYSTTHYVENFKKAFDFLFRKDIKIFDMDGGITWIAAKSSIEAINEHQNFTGEELDEEERRGVKEIDPADYDTFKFWDDLEDRDDIETENPETKRSFREQLYKMIDKGEGFPAFFASSEY